MMSIFWIVLGIAAWGAVHSFLASLGVKQASQRWFGSDITRWYRLGYNIFSVASFLPIVWMMAVLPDRPLYQVPAPWSYFMFTGQALAVLLLLTGLLQTDTLSFIGLRQLFGPEQPASLVTGGLYRWVRHPLYTAGLLILWLTPRVSLNSMVVFAGLSLYILAGAWFEERKLLREYGAVYAEYRRVTPMLIPGLILQKSDPSRPKQVGTNLPPRRL
jgi:protein-S-isoprenylcysteine O-methyltransferase Ste14